MPMLWLSVAWQMNIDIYDNKYYNNAMNKTRFQGEYITCTLPSHITVRLNQFNESVETSGMKIGRSFIMRFALEELFKRPDAREVLIERKIDALRAKELA